MLNFLKNLINSKCCPKCGDINYKIIESSKYKVPFEVTHTGPRGGYIEYNHRVKCRTCGRKYNCVEKIPSR